MDGKRLFPGCGKKRSDPSVGSLGEDTADRVMRMANQLGHKLMLAKGDDDLAGLTADDSLQSRCVKWQRIRVSRTW